MITLKQAVYTSVAIDGTIDYRLAGCSVGVASEDVDFLTWWGPGGDSLLETGPDALSYNYFALPSGALCVSRTTQGQEQSVYTQYLIIAADDFRHFGDNPFSLIRQALACGVLEVKDRVRKHLPDLSIPECPVAVDQRLLTRLTESIGPRNLALLVYEVLENKRLIVVSREPAAAIVSSVFSCLPIGVRHGFSFTTGLKSSSRRPTRLVAIGDDENERQRAEESSRFSVLDLTDLESTCNSHIDGWAHWIQTALTTGRIGFLAREITRQRDMLSSDELFALGLQLLEDVESLSLDSDDDAPVIDYSVDPQIDEFTSVAEDYSPFLQPVETADSHLGMEIESGEISPVPADACCAVQSPEVSVLDEDSPEVVDMLERLDDLVYEAMAGSVDASEELRAWWPEVLETLGETLIGESRAHYLSYAMKVWRKCTSGQGVADPTRAAIVLDVLCVLFDEETVHSICG